jgi:PAT family beta-lactamase induction signal transducer AmpG
MSATAPLALSERQTLRLLTFTLLYFAQGVPWGFIATGYPVLLTDLGLDNTAIGAAIGLAYLPWSFKILWGPLLDAAPDGVTGRRRPFVLVAQLFMGLTLLALGAADPRTHLGWVSAMLFLHNTAAALQDVAVDAMAVDLLQPHERGRANSMMWAGKSLGVVVGGGGGTLLAKALGWDSLFLAMAAGLACIALLPWAIPERPVPGAERWWDRSTLRLLWFLLPFALVAAGMVGLAGVEEAVGSGAAALLGVAKPFVAVAGALIGWRLVDPPGFGQLAHAFQGRRAWLGLAIAVTTPAGYALVAAASSRLLRADLHLTEAQIATLSGGVEPLAGVGGALVGGWLADRLGVHRAIVGCMVGIAAGLAAWALLPSLWPNWTFLLVWTVLFQALVNGYNAATLGLFMGLCDARIGATHFAVYMAATNLTYSWTAPAGGAIADAWGYPALYGVAAVTQLVAIAWIPWIARGVTSGPEEAGAGTVDGATARRHPAD